VTDVEGKVLVTTFPEVEISQNDIVTFAQSQADSQTMKNYQFFKDTMNTSWSTFWL